MCSVLLEQTKKRGISHTIQRIISPFGDFISFQYLCSLIKNIKDIIFPSTQYWQNQKSPSKMQNNVLLSGCTNDSLKSLQLILTHTLTRTKQYEHVSPVLASQHWCPVKSKSDVIVFCLSSKWLSSKLPQEMSCPLIPTNKFPECISPCYSKSIKKHNKRQSLLLLSPPPVE